MNRTKLAKKYLIGRGVEIGAGPSPWPMPPLVACVYVDYAPREKIEERFPGAGERLVDHIVADGFTLTREELTGLSPGFGVDFVVNSHVLEHCARPATAVAVWRELLNPGGHLVMAIPDKDKTFDKPRRITPWVETVEMDEEEFRRQQLREWGSVIDKFSGERLEQMVESMMASGADIHFPVWDAPALRYFFEQIVAGGGWRLREFAPVDHEVFVVLERIG